MRTPPWPDAGAALFFDFDGTLAPIAPSPETVQLDAGVPTRLRLLTERLGGAVAVVSGRPVAEIDHFLAPLLLPVAGVHGAERRGLDGFLRRVAAPSLDAAQTAVEPLLRADPRLRLERKPGAMALHYRAAPEREDDCIAAMTEAAQRVTGMALLCGKMVVELKPRRAGKGLALKGFLDERPFRLRRPWMFGDDVTDESAFEVVLALGGVAVKVGEGETLAPYRLANPAELLAWMDAALAALDTLRHDAVQQPAQEARAR